MLGWEGRGNILVLNIAYIKLFLTENNRRVLTYE